jgi:hypothetical protein
MATQPFSAMCAYNSEMLDEETISALGAVHPNSTPNDPFHLYNLDSADLALSGEIDAA